MGTALLLMLCLHAEPLKVEDAVQRALASSPLLKASAEKYEASADSARAVRGQLLPSVGLSDEYQHYDKPFAVAFGPQSFTARDQDTNTFAVGARQPLLGLLRLTSDHSAAELTAEGAKAQLESNRRGLREAVETGYLRLFEAKAAGELAAEAEKELAEQLTVMQARVKAGAATTADLLRLEVARANVQQQKLQAKLQESEARALLLVLLDYPLDAAIDFAEPEGLEAEGATPAPPIRTAIEQALEKRAELQQAAFAAQSAAATSRARFWAMLPELDAEAAYLRIDGQVFAPKDSLYVGVKASLPVFSWGSQWFAQRAAEHTAEAARQTAEDARHNVEMEVALRLDQISAASAAIEVARKAVESAQEAYRVTNELVQAGSGTTTDLLDAQGALTQSKLNLLRSRYEQALARVQLNRSIGG